MPLEVITLIATCDRFKLLTERALRSILNQSRLPDHLIIIDDSRNEINNLESITSQIPHKIKFTYLKNDRAKGVASAWNTGISYTLDNFDTPENKYIAILDDDDEWKENHLETCIKYAPQNDMVISGLIRHDENGTNHHVIPNKLDINALLVGNPGIQGSNIFVRLSSILEAGLFDENLLSSVDRDFCIRLAEIKINSVSTNDHTVHHYAESNRERLSSFGTINKIKSLQTFWDKYHCRMNSEQKQAFINRSQEKFGFSPEVKSPFLKKKSDTEPVNCTSLHLVVGVISANAKQLTYLLDDLCLVQTYPYITGLDVLIMHNGGDEAKLLNLSTKMINKGLNCYFISQEQQSQDALKGAFGKPFKRDKKQLSIGKARTFLQRYLSEFAHQKTDTIVWILDDDMQLDERAKKYLTWLPEFKKCGVDILLGTFEGASPNPATSGMRVQLVDLINNLEWLYSLDPNESLPDRSKENQKLRTLYPDYYYDLSRLHTAHLETVYWLTPAFQGETAAEAKNRMIKGVKNLFIGSSLLRPVIIDMPQNPIKEAQDSVNRGGNTFIFNSLALSKTPNAIIKVAGKDARRSDMIWALINRYYYDFKIMRTNFPVLHNRKVFGEPKLSIEKTVEEIQGSTLHAALKDFIGNNNQHNFEFDDNEKSALCEKFRYNLNKRLLSFRLSFFRIQGLCKALRKFDQEGELSDFLKILSDWYVNSTLNTITNDTKALSDECISNFLESLKPQIENYANSKVNISFLHEQKKKISMHLEQTLCQ